VSYSLVGLRRQLAAAGDLKSVVRAMKALAASSLGQYEKSVLSLMDYYRTIELGLNAVLRQSGANLLPLQNNLKRSRPGLIVFGSDQGLVGQFNESIAEFLKTAVPSSNQPKIWAVGERVAVALKDRGFVNLESFDLPSSIQAVAPLVGKILVSIEAFQRKNSATELHVFHHRPMIGAAYEPVCQRLLPIDKEWSKTVQALGWPTNEIPQIISPPLATFEALLREFLFVSLFRACVESLASENASRLVGMQRAEKNIDELSGDLTRRFHRLRQSSIDEELFDVISGFEAFSPPGRSHP
jgi:F-type H+-transporting ATPase subunit gamma